MFSSTKYLTTIQMHYTFCCSCLHLHCQNWGPEIFLMPSITSRVCSPEKLNQSTKVCPTNKSKRSQKQLKDKSVWKKWREDGGNKGFLEESRKAEKKNKGHTNGGKHYKKVHKYSLWWMVFHLCVATKVLKQIMKQFNIRKVKKEG